LSLTYQKTTTAGYGHKMTQLARERESLYTALSGDGNPSFATILNVMSALGVRLHADISHA
jgi:probable addiction module antidote protein